MARILALGFAVAALLSPAVASAHRLSAPRPSSSLEQKAVYLERVLAHDRAVLRFFRHSRPLSRPACPPPWTTRWRAHTGRAVEACLDPARRPALERELRFHKRQAIAASRDLRAIQRAILARADRNWGEAVRYADRCFPGVAGWLYAVSGSEGGGGLWTWNGHGNVISEATRARYRELELRFGVSYLLRYRPASAGSDVGGWVQFMPGTFYGYVDAAISAARSRGCRVLPEWRSWFSPAGQALTAGYMRWSGRSGGHWSASGH